VDTVFLDASVLFSAAYRAGAFVTKLWRLPEVHLISSAYAVGEANRNLEGPDQCARLAELLRPVQIVPAALTKLPGWVTLPDKDEPILQAAIAGHATHLLTSDVKHFGAYFWQIVEGVTILPPAGYLKGKI
jgi:hypothetical protein